MDRRRLCRESTPQVCPSEKECAGVWNAEAVKLPIRCLRSLSHGLVVTEQDTDDRIQRRQGGQLGVPRNGC
jgi:hypothetical protein